MQFNSHRTSAWVAWLLVVTVACAGQSQGQGNGEPLTREQDKLARDFIRGRTSASEEAKGALRLKMKAEVDRLKLPPARTFEEAEALAKLVDTRNNIDATWVTGARDPAARAVAVEALAVYGEMLLSEDVSPQSKVNCMAMLAELDEAGVNGAMPPTPSEKALGVLYKYARNDQVPVYLRAIALHGVNRHIGRWWPTDKWPDRTKQAIERTMADIVNSEPASPLDVRAHAWMVRRAYDCLKTMESPIGANSALNRLADPKALPSLRLAALEYLSRLDTSGFPEDKKSLHLIGLAHFTRSQLVNWYEKEDDTLKAKSGAAAGGMGGGRMDMAMGGGMMDMMGGGMMGGGRMGSDIGDMLGGSGGRRRDKPVDTQTWQVRLSRRLINQISQAAHVALDGVALPEGKPVLGVKPLKDAKLSAEEQAKIAKLIEAIELFQTAVNDPQRVRNMVSLLTQAEGNIEEIMDLVKEVPGFLVRYPELVPDEELDSAEDEGPLQADPANPDAQPGADLAKAAGEPADTGEPAEATEPPSPPPAEETTASNP
ncbi:MAG: hypothetical protein R3C09_16160 [Pirellulaceae bacterium]